MTVPETLARDIDTMVRKDHLNILRVISKSWIDGDIYDVYEEYFSDDEDDQDGVDIYEKLRSISSK